MASVSSCGVFVVVFSNCMHVYCGLAHNNSDLTLENRDPEMGENEMSKGTVDRLFHG